MSLNWSVFAVQRLKDFEDRKRAVNNLATQIKALEEKYTAIRASTTDGMPVQSGSENKREEMLIHNIAEREELQKNLDIIQHEIAVTEKGLEALDDEEKHILRRFFILREKGYVERLCDELFVSKTRLYQKKEAALKKFTLVCYGIVEL